MQKVKIIGAGLAGCEAAWQLANRGIKVILYEQKGKKRHPAFTTNNFAELICSNSLRSDNPLNAVGLLKNELRILNSLIMQCADSTRVPAGSSLAVDREAFSKMITSKIKSHPLIEVVEEEVCVIDPKEITIVATGPLCEGALASSIKKLINAESLYFYDAVAPLVYKESINLEKTYYKSRYVDEEKGDYINCPFNKDEYENFVKELTSASKIDVKEMDNEIFFEGCMPIEEMARRGLETLRHGPLKPMGLRINGKTPYAVVQLRQDNATDSLYNLVGFQTHLTFGEQKRVFSMIPGLENGVFARYGVMHRNTYINSPKLLNCFYQLNDYPNLYFAGQISGVEGYVESCASGCYCALSLWQRLCKNKIIKLSEYTMMGALASYISNPVINKFVPMNANFGLVKEEININKNDRKNFRVTKAIQEVKAYKEALICE